VSERRGVAVRCSRDGVIDEVIRDEVGVVGVVAGVKLAQLVAPGSERKCERFLTVVRETGAAFGWELDVPLAREGICTLSFAGIVHRDQVLAIGARLLDDIFSLYEELTRVNNEEVNLLRRAIKERVLVTQRGVEGNALDELSRLNNELVNLQRDLAKQNRALERLNEEKNTLLGIAAHDLRNPIASIKGHAALLLESELEPRQRERALQAIGRASEHMLTLVNDLLDVSVIESGRLELRRERCDLGELLARRVEFFQLLGERKSIRVVTSIEPGLVLAVDPGRIEQVIDNLISNAVKYSPHGSSVEVRARREERGVVIEVRDQGPGLTEEDQRRLFGTFQRLSARPTGGEKSTGLGLAITLRVVRAHGGSIAVESTPGAGATFGVVLPEGPELAPSAPTAARSRPIRVLVVDDDEDIRLAVELALTPEHGFEVVLCASLAEARAALDRFAPDLLLLDVEMPVHDGPATLALLRREPAAAAAPAVFLTARVEAERVVRYRELGAVDVVPKPFALPALRERLQAVVAAR
jgi:signal transduction histidine kinase/CheY-like chemotaxis protein